VGYIPILDELSNNFKLLVQDYTCGMVVLGFALLLVLGIGVGCLFLYLTEAMERWDNPKA
jgi:hypothetical protein